MLSFWKAMIYESIVWCMSLCQSLYLPPTYQIISPIVVRLVLTYLEMVSSEKRLIVKIPRLIATYTVAPFRVQGNTPYGSVSIPSAPCQQ
jgi:hypothetical protein